MAARRTPALTRTPWGTNSWRQLSTDPNRQREYEDILDAKTQEQRAFTARVQEMCDEEVRSIEDAFLTEHRIYFAHGITPTIMELENTSELRKKIILHECAIAGITASRSIEATWRLRARAHGLFDQLRAYIAGLNDAEIRKRGEEGQLHDLAAIATARNIIELEKIRLRAHQDHIFYSEAYRRGKIVEWRNQRILETTIAHEDWYIGKIDDDPYICNLCKELQPLFELSPLGYKYFIYDCMQEGMVEFVFHRNVHRVIRSAEKALKLAQPALAD
jgi:hypothetical protein